MSRRPTITAAIITHNEERNLRELLAGLAWVDEIVVVDGGSRDATVEIAHDQACCVAIRRFDNFAWQRNHALRLANGDWVLSIDADERPTSALIDEVRERVADVRMAAFHVPIHSSIFGRRMRFSGTQDDRPVRLFRRDAARWTGDVHERLRVRGRVGELRHGLAHVTLPDRASFVAKMDRYTTLEAAARVEAGRRPRLGERWLAPPWEAFRRLVWKQGYFDGPEGIAFCLLSGLSAWVLANKHRRFWREYRGGHAHRSALELASGDVRVALGQLLTRSQ